MLEKTGYWLIKKLSQFLSYEKPKKKSYLCDFKRLTHEARIADVLLIEGSSRISMGIQRITHSAWTHAVLYIGRLHDIDDPKTRELIQHHYQGHPRERLVIESVIGKGTVITPLEFYNGDHIRICRPRGISHDDAEQVIAHATRSLGREYSIIHILDLARFFLMGRLVPAKVLKRLLHYRPGKATEEICSMMIAESFGHIQFPVLPHIRPTKQSTLEVIKRNPRLYSPSDFDYSPYFNIIKYPIFETGDHAAYKDMPWNNTLMSNDTHIIDSPENQSNNQTQLD